MNPIAELTDVLAKSRPLEPVIAAFVEDLEAIDRRPLIILDTCEELAKIRPDGELPPNVSVTFDILERVAR